MSSSSNNEESQRESAAVNCWPPYALVPIHEHVRQNITHTYVRTYLIYLLTLCTPYSSLVFARLGTQDQNVICRRKSRVVMKKKKKGAERRHLCLTRFSNAQRPGESLVMEARGWEWGWGLKSFLPWPFRHGYPTLVKHASLGLTGLLLISKTLWQTTSRSETLNPLVLPGRFPSAPPPDPPSILSQF